MRLTRIVSALKHITIVALILLASTVYAHDYIPAVQQSQPILIKGGDLQTVSNGVMPQTDLLFENGRITAIAKNITPPEKCKIIDVSGKIVYPGLIAPNSSIGLTEIGAVRATNDRREVGGINPNIKSATAYNPDSEIIPSVRSNGITTVLVVPGGSLLRGQSSLINLDGWTIEDATEKASLGMHLNWPKASISTGWWVEKSAEDQKKDMAENRKLLHQLFDDARAYQIARQDNPEIKKDGRWESMIPVLEGRMPLFVHAGDARQIEQAVDFCRDLKLNMVLVGGTDAWKLSQLLIENNIPVIFRKVQSLPAREDDPHDLSYKTPALLEKAGVNFCLSNGSATSVRNLPFQAGQAVAFGLSPEMALRSITLSTAEILGVSDDLGSLEVGKKATIIVSEGDIMDHLGHRVILEFINGAEVDLNNKHKELFEKYKHKH